MSTNYYQQENYLSRSKIKKLKFTQGFTLIRTPLRRNLVNVQQGFTLIELLIVIILMSLLAGAFLTLQYILSQNQITVWRNYISLNEANNSLFSLVREARIAKNGENGSFAIETAEDDEFTFYSDYDFDGVVERLRYFLDGSNLSRGVIEPTSFPISYPAEEEKVKILSENIRNGATPVFYYYNEDWPSDTINNPLLTPSNPSEIKLVRIYLRLNTNANQPENDYLLESYSQLRMLKSNL